MTLPVSVPNVPEWQYCRLTWKIRDYGGMPVVVDSVVFTSAVPYVIAAGSKYTLVSVFPEAHFTNGVLCNDNGDEYVDIVASEDPDISPHHWTITAVASIAASGSRPRQAIQATFTTPVGGDLDLSTVLTVPASSGQAITRGKPGRGIEAVTAVGTTATVTYDDGTTSTFTLPEGAPGTGGGGSGGLTPDPNNPGYYLISGSSSLTPDPGNPGYYLIGA